MTALAGRPQLPPTLSAAPSGSSVSSSLSAAAGWLWVPRTLFAAQHRRWAERLHGRGVAFGGSKCQRSPRCRCGRRVLAPPRRVPPRSLLAARGGRVAVRCHSESLCVPRRNAARGLGAVRQPYTGRCARKRRARTASLAALAAARVSFWVAFLSPFLVR